MRKAIHLQHRQWATATSAIKSKYFWFATTTLNFMRNELSHAGWLHTIGFIMCGSYKIALYTVLKSVLDGDILLLPVRVRHVENVRIMVAYTIVYTPLRRIILTVITFVNITRVFHSHSCLQRYNPFFWLTGVHFVPNEILQKPPWGGKLPPVAVWQLNLKKRIDATLLYLTHIAAVRLTHTELTLHVRSRIEYIIPTNNRPTIVLEWHFNLIKNLIMTNLI